MPFDALSALLTEIQAQAPRPMLSSAVTMAGRTIRIDCDERGLFDEFFTMFGSPEPTSGAAPVRADMHLTICSLTGTNLGWFHMAGDDELPLDGVEFRFSVNQENGAFENFEQPDPTWTCFAFRGATVPAFAFHERDCLFSLEPRWRSNIMWLLFWRLLRIRTDAIFFHASAMGLWGQGTMLVGPSGAGKSTTSLALAARGHNFLSDEVAAYLPQTGDLFPFRRPVGIKPGPRSRAVARGLSKDNASKIARDGFVRFDVSTLFAVGEPRPVPLRNVIFLRGFAKKPSLSRISAGRGEIAELQPLMSSFLDAPHGRRIIELSRLLSAAKVYELRLGEPDETAAYLERAIA